MRLWVLRAGKVYKKTIEYLPKDVFTIADAKRGDIGNTSKMYAKAFFEQMNFDSITVAPYMGSDSVEPFLEFEDRWVILLALTSNKGGKDFQFEELKIWRESLSKSIRGFSEMGNKRKSDVCSGSNPL